jgi:hypothetical protein
MNNANVRPNGRNCCVERRMRRLRQNLKLPIAV